MYSGSCRTNRRIVESKNRDFTFVLYRGWSPTAFLGSGEVPRTNLGRARMPFRELQSKMTVNSPTKGHPFQTQTHPRTHRICHWGSDGVQTTPGHVTSSTTSYTRTKTGGRGHCTSSDVTRSSSTVTDSTCTAWTGLYTSTTTHRGKGNRPSSHRRLDNRTWTVRSSGRSKFDKKNIGLQ